MVDRTLKMKKPKKKPCGISKQYRLDAESETF